MTVEIIKPVPARLGVGKRPPPTTQYELIEFIEYFQKPTPVRGIKDSGSALAIQSEMRSHGWVKASHSGPFEFSLSDIRPASLLTATDKLEFSDFTLTTDYVRLTHVNGALLTVSSNSDDTLIQLIGCRLRNLTVIGNVGQLALIDTIIGRLDISSSSIHSFKAVGGAVLGIMCLDEKSPFTGACAPIFQTILPTTQKLQWSLDKQPYRNLRRYAEAMDNAELALFFRDREMRCQPDADESLVFKLARWLNHIPCHGYRPERSLLVGSAAVVLAALVIGWFDGAVLTENNVYGWQRLMKGGASPYGPYIRALALAIQAINPLSLFEPRKLVVAANPAWAAFAAAVGLFVDVMLGQLALAIRRRFKMS